MIPRNLSESISSLKDILGDKYFNEFKNGTENDLAGWHSDLGRYIRNAWKLWEGSDLVDYFKGLGITHPDDISGIILTSAHREWNSKEIDLESQIKLYQDYWKKNG